MSERIVNLDYAEVREAIEAGDNAYGRRWLAVSPNGSYRIHWADNQRQWDPWGKEDKVIALPALFPEGDGEEYEMAVDCLQDHQFDGHQYLYELENELEETGKYSGLVEYAWDLHSEWMRAAVDNALDFLCDAFLAACNGDGTDLNWVAPWGYSYGDDPYIPESEVEPPFRFEWG